MHVVFGIGNPGPEYLHTRHNLGFAVVTAIAEQASAPLVPIRGLNAEGARVRLGRAPVLLVKPLTYVNRCGAVLAALRQRLRLVSLEGVLAEDDFYRLDPHLRPSGHVKVAAEIERALAEAGLLESESAGG